MKLLCFILFLLFFILFLPIPLKFTIYYSLEDYYLRIYKFTIISKKKKNISTFSNKFKTFNKKNKLKLSFSKYKKFLSSAFYSKFKPSLKINLKLSYSLNDAYNTAIIYGVLCSISPFLNTFINTIFKIKKYHLNLNPIFKDEFLVKIEISSIIYISFAQTIYMATIFIKNIKEGTP